MCWASQRTPDALLGDSIHRGFLAAGAPSFAQAVQKIPYPLFRHEEGRGEGVGPLFGPRLGIVSTCNTSQLITVHKRMTVFVCVGKPSPHQRLGKISQNRDAKVGTAQKETGDFTRQMQSGCPYILVGQRLRYFSYGRLAKIETPTLLLGLQADP